MPRLWHKDRLWPDEVSPLMGTPLPHAIPPGIYCESKEDWTRIRTKGVRPGLDPIRRVGVPHPSEPGIAPAGLMMKVATPEQLAWMKANEKAEIPRAARPLIEARGPVSPLPGLRSA